MARGEGDYRPAGPANEASSPAPAAGNLLDAEVSTLDSDDKPGLERRINRLNGTGDGKVFSEQKVGLKGNTYTLPRLSSRLFGGKKKALKALAQNPGAIATFTDSVRVGAKMMAKEAADLRMDGDHAGAEKLENKALEYMLESLADLHAAVDLMSDQVTESLPNTLEESALGLATEFLNLRDQVPQDGPLNASAHEGFQSAGALKEKIDAKRETGNTLAMMRGKIAEAKANPVNLNYRISLDSAASGEDAGPPEAAEDSDLGATREQAIKQFAGRHRRRSGSNPFKATTVAGMKVPRARHSGIARLSGNPEALGQYTGLVLDSLKAMTEQANLLIADGVRLDREGDPEGRDKQQLADLKNFAATEILFKMVPHDGGGRSERAAVDANSETATALRSLIAKLFDPSVQPAATVSPPPAPDHTEHNAAVLDFYLNATGDPRTGIVNGVRVPPKNVGFDAIAEYITGNVERFDQHTELTLYGLSHLCRQAELLKAADPSTPQTQDQVRSAYARAAMYAEDSLAAALTAADGTKGHNAEKLGELKNLIEVELLEKMPLPAPRFPNSRVPAQHPRFVQQLINLVDSSRD